MHWFLRGLLNEWGLELQHVNPTGVLHIAGFVTSARPSSGSYPAYTPYDSNRGWHGEWFYIRNPVEAPFPPFTRRRPERRESWSWGPSSR